MYFSTSVYSCPCPRLSLNISWADPRRNSQQPPMHACGKCLEQEARERPRPVCPEQSAASSGLRLPGSPWESTHPISWGWGQLLEDPHAHSRRRHLGHFPTSPTVSASKPWAAVNLLPSLRSTDASFRGQLVVTRQRSKYLGQPGWSVPPILGLVRP